jgi:hypothetical protein
MEDFCIKTNDGVTLYPTETIKLLGITIDKRLTMQEHVSETAKKIGFAIKMTSLVGKFLDYTTKKTFSLYPPTSRLLWCSYAKLK